MHIHAQVTLPYKTSLPEDVSVNNWSFDLADDDGANLGQAAQFLESFYTDVASLLSPVLDLENSLVKFYRRSDPEPRTPIGESVLDFGTGNTGGVFPEEAAVCLSFRGVLASGTPAARRRGRVFLGPVSSNVNGTGLGLRSEVAEDARDQIIAAYETAWGFLTTAGNVHEVWSPTNSDGYPVVRAWVDNAFDIQRSRGTSTTAVTVTNGPW